MKKGIVASADDCILLLSGSVANNPFATVFGTASSGSAGLSIPVPSGQISHFLLAGRNEI